MKYAWAEAKEADRSVCVYASTWWCRCNRHRRCRRRRCSPFCLLRICIRTQRKHAKNSFCLCSRVLKTRGNSRRGRCDERVRVQKYTESQCLRLEDVFHPSMFVCPCEIQCCCCVRNLTRVVGTCVLACVIVSVLLPTGSLIQSYVVEGKTSQPFLMSRLPDTFGSLTTAC